jgi:hypothetical protein
MAAAALRAPRPSPTVVGAYAGAGLALSVVFWVLRRPRVEVRTGGIRVVNYVGSRRIPWSDIVLFELPKVASWARAILADGTVVPLHAVQPPVVAWLLPVRSRAHRSVDELNRALAVNGDRRPPPLSLAARGIRPFGSRA